MHPAYPPTIGADPSPFELALQGVRRQERKGNKAGEAGLGLGQAIYG